MTRLLISLFCLGLMAASPVMSQDTPLSAAQSDPETLGWMQGFPPPADRIIRMTDADAFTFPKLRWTMCNFRELTPTKAVRNGTDGADKLPVALDPGIDAVNFTPMGSDRKMTWDQAFDVNYTDGILVLHRGRIVYERYGGCMDENSLHGVMSVSKSLTGLVAETLVAEGALDETALMRDVIPELDGSGFGDATVRQVLEMTTALDYSEDYADPNSDVWTYSRASSPLPPPEGYDGPRSYFGYLQTVRKSGAHGEAFAYRTINADAVGWLIARVSGQDVADWVSQNIWSHIGAEREAFFTVDSIGTPFAGGGFNVTLRDLARLGQLVLDRGNWQGQQILPAQAIDRIRQGGDPQAFARAGYDTLPGWSYRGMWWVSNDDHGAFAARGVHGQTIWIDPAAQMVIVRVASNPVAANAANDPTSLPAYRAVADYLMAKDGFAQVQDLEWRIEDIDGRGVIDYSAARLTFGADGKLSGNASCNRLMGIYQVDGDSLTLQQLGTTRKACPEALMAQERLLLDLLGQITGWRLSPDGGLILYTKDDRQILARHG